MEVKNSVYFEHNRKEQKVYYALMALPLICNMNATLFLHREMYSNIFFWIHSKMFYHSTKQEPKPIMKT